MGLRPLVMPSDNLNPPDRRKPKVFLPPPTACRQQHRLPAGVLFFRADELFVLLCGNRQKLLIGACISLICSTLKNRNMRNHNLPKHLSDALTPRGLYDPSFEHDACGVGMICNMHGEKSHRIIAEGLQILVNLTHRGACGCDETTGDGAGILMQMPHVFLKKISGQASINLPAEKEYASGLVFLPPDPQQRQICMDHFEAVVQAEKQQFLGWRRVPVVSEALGELARQLEPAIFQIFIGRGPGGDSQASFERKLFVIRKVIENFVRESQLTEASYFHIPSLSSQTLVYKGMLLADQIEAYYSDLADPDMASALAIVHQRYSTNTFPTWDLAHPFRFLCHNGEINTLRGNINWMNARQWLFQSEHFGEDMAKLFPIATPGASDSAIFDNAIELLYHSGRSLPHAIMMLIPEAWEKHATMSDAKKAFYEYHACLMEPWDGPASIAFSDGTCIGAVLDRNGLRPSRYTVTKDGYVIMASETGVLEVKPENVHYKGRLQPGRMFLIDIDKGRIVDDEEIKAEIAARQPYRQWLTQNLLTLDQLPHPEPCRPASSQTRSRSRALARAWEPATASAACNRRCTVWPWC